MRLPVLVAALAALTARPLPAPAGDGVIERAIGLMGGEQALRGVERVRFETMTQWLRTSWDERPFADQVLSYEMHTDLRDYTLRAWRNTRRFLPSGPGRELTDVVADSIAIRRIGSGGWVPLNVAYVDERRELFALAPERLLLAALDDRGRRVLADTSIDGVAHARVVTTVGGLPATLFVRASDGLLAAARLRAAQPNDFGLTAWGEMDVEVWYSRWNRFPNGLAYPMQLDVRRVGRPYKRMTILQVAWNPPATPDSFAISDSLRQGWGVSARLAMHDLRPDSARMQGDRLVEFRTPGYPAGAVRLGTSWVVLDGGIAPLSARRAVEWLATSTPSATVTHAVVAVPGTGTAGGAAWLAGHGIEVVVGTGAARFVSHILAAQGSRARAPRPVVAPRWIRAGGDSALVAPIDLPDNPGSLAVYVPSLRWVFTSVGAAPWQLDLVLAHARAQGWMVESVGTPRAIRTTVPR